MAPFEFHVGQYVDSLVKWLLNTYGDGFDSFASWLLGLLLGIENVLHAIPWWAFIAAIVIAALLLTRQVVMSFVLGALLIVVVGFGLWDPTMNTLAIVITSVVLALAIGIPLGIAGAEFRIMNAVMRPLLDAMQTMPSFVYLIPAMMLFGLGKVPAVLATLVYSLPPVIRLTQLGIENVSADVQEAAIAYGATRWQLLKEVRLPLAMPSVLTGVNQTTMMALAMVVIAAMIGARGVGEEVLLSINRLDIARGFEAGLAVVALAIVIDRLTQGIAARWQVETKVLE